MSMEYAETNRVAKRVMDGWNDKMSEKMETECGCRCLILGCSVQVDSNFLDHYTV